MYSSADLQALRFIRRARDLGFFIDEIAGDDILKCALRPIDGSDYPQPLPPQLMTRMKAAFPEGVCDWSKPGVGQTQQVGVWLRYDGKGNYAAMPN